MPTPPCSQRNVTRSIHRAVALLRLLATHTRPGWRLSDLAQHAGLDPATVHRLLASLCDEGLAVRVPDSLRYSVGQTAYELGLAARPFFDLDQLAANGLAALAKELGGTLFLKIRSGVDSLPPSVFLCSHLLARRWLRSAWHWQCRLWPRLMPHGWPAVCAPRPRPWSRCWPACD